MGARQHLLAAHPGQRARRARHLGQKAANVTDPAQLPRTIPASISLKPQILVDGQLKAEGSAMRVGNEPVGVGGFTRYGSSQWDETQDPGGHPKCPTYGHPNCSTLAAVI